MEIKEYKNYKEADVKNYGQKKLFAEKFFYTIATNYSIQSFVASDYAHEHTFTYDPELELEKNEDNNKGVYVYKHTGSWQSGFVSYCR